MKLSYFIKICSLSITRENSKKVAIQVLLLDLALGQVAQQMTILQGNIIIRNSLYNW